MKFKKFILALACLSSPLYADQDQQLKSEIQRLQHQAEDLQAQLNRLQKQLASHKSSQQKHKQQAASKQAELQSKPTAKPGAAIEEKYHSTKVEVHAPDAHPESISFYPTALIADNRVVTYIAGTPVVSSPFLGDRPAFDGSDYIVNISSINRDVRLMQQRRRLYRAYQKIGYPIPNMPIISLSGKAEPAATFNNPFRSTNTDGDITLGSSELDVAAALNENVEAYIAIAYDESPPAIGPRVNNSAFNLNMGFVNIGNLDKSPLYFTAGQVYVPFGRYSSAMVSAPVTMNLARTKTRPVIFGYKSQADTGPFGAVYGYRSDTTLGRSGVGGVNLGYIFGFDNDINGEIGGGFISSIADAGGMQSTGANVGTTFGGFGSITNGNENVRKTKAADVHGHVGYDRYNLTLEWVGAIQSFRPQDLSFNGQGARPQAAQAELGMTFMAFNRPASIGVGYQWTKEALALNLPKQRYIGVFNISIWKDTVESIEYRHDIDYGLTQFANGAAPPGLVNLPTLGTGKSADTVSAQIGVYF
ncbi:TPA: FlxA-like family protein [Legionella pneumophila]|nr:LbtU family siderophore porin [Legionella pneumophila]HAT2067922.1 LbtU family siderophore porin [Legionella pneumophila]HAT8592384.1 LbtU family siderophore porin [Legionella pneumophila]HAU1578160.1 LbtU family siderophore porin [Legionella pneumophila]HAU1682323.1 LbtU family siderophore porin [Legionella pneumophila]HAU3701791.1 LbtU family siderophore porin [Legionella pneumophila]